jgi:uncharacterized protein (DUF2141 family)
MRVCAPLLVPLLALLLNAPAMADVAAAATLVVRAEGIDSRAGLIVVAVCAGGFDERGCPRGAKRAPGGGGVDEFTFEGLPPGRYGVAAYYDSNGNGRLDKVPPGVPTEPYGFSNDVGRLTPPDFAAALVEVGAGGTTVVVRLRRFLGLP